MKLSYLIQALNKSVNPDLKIISGCKITSDVEITSLHYRAQDVISGGLFIALKGAKADGHDYINQALKNGAAAIISHRDFDTDFPFVKISDSRKALAALAARFYDYPSTRLKIIGITGTNGKTTTSYLIEKILEKAGYKVGVIGTVNYRYMGKKFDNPVTTPESLDLQKILADMQNSGITHVVMEVSSHAIKQNRIFDCCFAIGVFTNLTQDHLDYHQNMSEYWSCKKSFFSQYFKKQQEEKKLWAIINCDNSWGTELAKELKSGVLGTGLENICQIRPKTYEIKSSRIIADLSTPLGDFKFSSPLTGKFNLENILSAVGAGIALDIPLKAIKAGLESLSTVPGRMERVSISDNSNSDKRNIYIDYAHTPDALENVLKALRVLSRGRVICVFGCGGDRDKTKRPLMGKIAGKLADLVVITSDNPRSENPQSIISQIISGLCLIMPNSCNPSEITKEFITPAYVVEADRQKAIELSIKISRQNDIILIAGKGHETYQILGDETIHFDDYQVAAKALSRLKPKKKEKKARDNKIPWAVSQLLEATQGKLLSKMLDLDFKGISIDSRQIMPDEIFVAIKGSNQDAHSFINEVLAKKVRGVVINQANQSCLPPDLISKSRVIIIGVPDTTRALGDLAAYNRQRADIKVVAITGSNGKTTTRKMVSQIISSKFNTLSTKGNFNNEFGLPLTLFNLSPEHQAAVLELGMNHAGEISRLGEICRPDIGLITNIGFAHLEGLGSLKAILKAKAELLSQIKPGGWLVLNADDPLLLSLAEKFEKIILFGLSDRAMVRACAVKQEYDRICFDLILPGKPAVPINLNGTGEIMVQNALAAAAVGHILNLSPDMIKKGLESFTLVQGRMNILKTKNGYSIIDDTYNSNPDSVKAAMNGLISLKGVGRGFVVIGDMLELGDYSIKMHQGIGSLLAKAGAAGIYACGKFAQAVADGAIKEKMPAKDIIIGEKPALISHLVKCLEPGDWVLVKGSRKTAMEEVVAGLGGFL